MRVPSRRALSCRLHEAGLYLADALRRSDPGQVRAVIFAQGRTGSTLLESLLDATGHFVSRGELLSCDEREPRRPLAYMRGSARRAAPRHVVGHVKVYHLTRDRRRPVDPARFLGALHADGWRIVHLVRGNILRHGLSTLVAEARGEFHRFHDRDEELVIDVDPEALRGLLAERRAFARDEAAALGDLPRVTVRYEDDLADGSRHQQTADRLLDAFGLPRRPVAAGTRKVNRFEPRDLIRNYDAIDAVVREEGLSW
jgi:hypothetical protein